LHLHARWVGISAGVTVSDLVLNNYKYKKTAVRELLPGRSSFVVELVNAIDQELKSNALLFELHVKPEAADFIGKYVEAGRGAGLKDVLAFDHGLVDLGTTLDVVRLDG
jgi:hypothetical protein